MAGCDKSFTRQALSTIFCADVKQGKTISLSSAVKLVATTTGFDNEAILFGSCLAGVVYDFLQHFPLSAFRIGEEDLGKWIMKHSLVPVILLQSPDQSRLKAVAQACKLSAHDFVKENRKILLPFVIIGEAINELTNLSHDMKNIIKLGKMIEGFDLEEPSVEEITETIFYAFSMIDNKVDQRNYDIDEDYIHILSEEHILTAKVVGHLEDYLATVLQARNIYEYLCRKKPSSISELCLRFEFFLIYCFSRSNLSNKIRENRIDFGRL